MIVLVTGAGGFIGRRVARSFASRGHRVRALVRDRKHAAVLEDVDCELVRGDVSDLSSLTAATEGCDTVVNLVGLLSGSREELDRVIARGTANCLLAAAGAGAERFVQMSALGVEERTRSLVPYYRAKWDAEQAVRASGVSHAILRPSFAFGPDSPALSRFFRIARLTPVTPIPGPGTQRIQPIWADDLAEIAVQCAEGSQQGTLALGGPDVVSWNELWELIKEALGTRRPTLHVPFWALRPPASLLERLPAPLVTRDQLKMLAADNVAEPNDAERFGLALLPLREQLDRAVAGDPPEPTADDARVTGAARIEDGTRSRSAR
jgi:NADH dehydrogenase